MMPVYWFVKEQGDFLLLLFSLGIALGLCYDVIRVLRRVFGTRRVITDIVDFLYWMGVTFVLWVVLNVKAGKSLRYYHILAVALGMLLYYVVMSPVVCWILYTPLHYVTKLLGKLYRYMVGRLECVCKIGEQMLENRKESMDMKKQQKRKRRAKTNRLPIVCLGLFMILALSVQMVRLYQKNQEYIQKEASLQSQVQELEQEKEELAQYETYINSKEYVVDTAKKKLGLIFDNEIIFREN